MSQLFLWKIILQLFEKMCVFILRWNLKHWAWYLSVQLCIHLLVHNLGVLKANLTSTILHLMSFNFKVAKQKVTSKITSFFKIFGARNTKFLFCAWFRVEKCIHFSFRSKWPIFDLQIQNGYRQHTNGSLFMNLNYTIIKLICLWKSRNVDYVIRKIRLQGIRNYA